MKKVLLTLAVFAGLTNLSLATIKASSTVRSIDPNVNFAMVQGASVSNGTVYFVAASNQPYVISTNQPQGNNDPFSILMGFSPGPRGNSTNSVDINTSSSTGQMVTLCTLVFTGSFNPSLSVSVQAKNLLGNGNGCSVSSSDPAADDFKVTSTYNNTTS